MILSWEGQSLCSRRDPMKESLDWLASQKVNPQAALVLGAGAGFHLKVLLEKFDSLSILVIDHRQILLDQISNSSPRIETLCVSNEIEMWWSDQVIEKIQKNASIHLFGPAFQTHRELYLDLSRSLRGQTSLGFNERAQLYHFSASWAQTPLEFQIKSLMDAKIQTEDLALLKCLRVLRELVE